VDPEGDLAWGDPAPSPEDTILAAEDPTLPASFHFDEAQPAPIPPAPAPPQGPPPQRLNIEAFGTVDQMPTRDKLRAFP
jgi:hypothetical protein